MNEECQNQTLDIRDCLSPLAVLKVRSLLNNMKDGQILEVWSNDFETRVVLEQVIKNSNDELLSIEKQREYEKIYIKRHTNIPLKKVQTNNCLSTHTLDRQ